MEEGIVRNFYWVVPGGLNEFKQSGKIIKNILKDISRYEGNKKEILDKGNGVIYIQCLGRNFIVCTLDNLPVITKGVLLDIDTDFLVIDSVLNADNTQHIGKRRPWILPQDLVRILKEKIKSPEVITIAYSVNGGWTPIKYKHLGDELAYSFSPLKFKRRFEINHRAAGYFNLFDSTGKKEYYHRAITLNPTYRITDNNYGPLYLALRKFSRAQHEFARILKVDSKNPGPLLGLGEVTLEKKDFKKAKGYLESALRFSERNRLFGKVKKQILFNLGRAEFNLKNFNAAKKLLFAYRGLAPLEPESYFLLGYIFEKEKKFAQAAILYKDTLRLGKTDIGALLRLARISVYLKEKDEIMKFVNDRYRGFKQGFVKFKKLHLKKRKKRGLKTVERKMLALEKRLGRGYKLERG
jgi:tetratricopeptide (TPR) repeat protein